MAGNHGFELTRAQRATYSVGMFSSAIVTANILAWVLYFYSPPPNAVDGGMVFLGVGVAIGVARIIGSLVDAVTNPLVAFWSDRSTHPRGRRVPFIMRGTLPLMCFAILIWFPPVRGTSMWNVTWLAVTLSATWFFYTYVVAPYLALMPELTSNPRERVSLTVNMAYWEAGATLIAALGVPPMIEAFKGGIDLGPLFIADGFKLSAIILAVMGAIGFFVAISRVREKQLEAAARTTFSLVRSVVECFRNPAFGPYVAAVFAAKIGIGFVMITMPFLTTAVLHKGEGFTAMLLAPLFLATIIGFVVAEKLVNRVGLKTAFRFATLAAGVLVLGFVGIYFLGGRGVPLQRFEVAQNGDRILLFASTPEALDSADELGPDESFSRTGDVVTIRLTGLQWRRLFNDFDRDSFNEAIEEMDDESAAALLREGAEVPERRQIRDWLQDLSNDRLLVALGPEAAPLLLPRAKRRFEGELFLGNPSVEAPPDGSSTIHLAFTAGLLEAPEETVNLDGWRMMFMSPEERDALGPAVRPTVRDEESVLLEGRISFTDGNLLFSNFQPLPDQPRGPAADRLFEDPAELEYLISRFELRQEYQWGSRIWLALLISFLLGFPAAILMSMYRPIVCEIVDLDEQRVGTRREAMYFGVEGLLTKSADGVAAMLTPAAMLIGHWLLPPPFGYVLPFAAGTIVMMFAFIVFGRYPLGAPEKQQK